MQMYVTVKLITSKTLKPRSKATKMMAGISRPKCHRTGASKYISMLEVGKSQNAQVAPNSITV